jgi:quercetin dioxygenase-like cupin family protein
VIAQQPLTQVSLDEAIARLAPTGASGRRSETLLKTPRLRVVLVTMRAGAELNEHAAPGPIVIQPLRGRFTVLVDREAREIAAGTMVGIEGDIRHTVRAIEDGAFLLTIAWPGEASGADE